MGDNILHTIIDAQDFDVALGNDFPLSNGGERNGASITCRTEGPDDAPVVLVLGGISATRFFTDGPGKKGWWRAIIGPGKALDTDRYRVVGYDYLDGGPLQDPAVTGRKGPWAITSNDQARAIEKLRDHLGLDQFYGVAGASYGACVAIAYASKFPGAMGRILAISGAHIADPMSVAMRSLQRRILHEGLDRGEELQAVVLARALAMTTYRSREEFADRFNSPPRKDEWGFKFPVEDYLDARGRDFAGYTSAARFLALSESQDLQFIEPEIATVPAVFVGISEDRLVPIEDMRALAKRYGGQSKLLEFESRYAHDAFLKEDEIFSGVMRDWLD